MPRVILGSPVAGIAADEIIDGTPAVHEILQRFIGSEEFSNLPRKFKTAISGSPRQDVAHEIHDIAFVGRGASRARPRLRPLGRRRAVHQPDAGPAAGRLGAAGRGRRCLGRRHLDLPRLRLPPAAEPGPAEVPGRRLGRREVPRGSRAPVPQAHADRRPGPGGADRSPRPRRRAPAERRQVLRRDQPDGRPGVRHAADPDRRRRRGARLAADPDHHRPGPGHPRRRAPTGSTRWSPPSTSWACRSSRRPSGGT